MVPDKMTPMIQANLFCLAPTYSGVCLLTISLPMISVGENLGLINTRMTKSVRKSVIAYFASIKSLLNKIRIRAKNITKKRMPAAARISRSFKTGISYPSTVSPNCITFSMACWFGCNWMIFSCFCYTVNHSCIKVRKAF